MKMVRTHSLSRCFKCSPSRTCTPWSTWCPLLTAPRPFLFKSWFLPHYLVKHSGKHGLVFNSSFPVSKPNDNLLPGPILGPSSLGVLLRFRQQSGCSHRRYQSSVSSSMSTSSRQATSKFLLEGSQGRRTYDL